MKIETRTGQNKKVRIAVGGAGVSGIAAASILNRNGHATVLFDR